MDNEVSFGQIAIYLSIQLCVFSCFPKVLKYDLDNFAIKLTIYKSCSKNWNKTTIIILRVHTFIHIFIGCKVSFYCYKNNKSSQMFHTGPSLNVLPAFVMTKTLQTGY